MSTTALGRSPARSALSLGIPLKKQLYKNRYYYLLLIPAIALLHPLSLQADVRRAHRLQGLPDDGWDPGEPVGGVSLLRPAVQQSAVLSRVPQHRHHQRAPDRIRVPGTDTARPAPERDIPRTLQEDRPDHLLPSPFHIVGRDRWHAPRNPVAQLWRGERRARPGRYRADFLPGHPGVLPGHPGRFGHLAGDRMGLDRLSRRDLGHRRAAVRSRLRRRSRQDPAGGIPSPSRGSRRSSSSSSFSACRTS